MNAKKCGTVGMLAATVKVCVVINLSNSITGKKREKRGKVGERRINKNAKGSYVCPLSTT